MNPMIIIFVHQHSKHHNFWAMVTMVNLIQISLPDGTSKVLLSKILFVGGGTADLLKPKITCIFPIYNKQQQQQKNGCFVNLCKL